MNPVHLFDLAAQHARWATVRQAAVAGNISNANTPGYVPVDVQPFSAVFDDTALTMASTTSGHVTAAGIGAGAAGWVAKEVGGSVAVDQEMIKAAEINGAFALDTTIIRSFHRMLMMSVRSGA